MSTAPRPIQPFQGSYLTPAFEHATVGDAMHVGIVTCPPDAPLTMVARTMATHHVHCIAVLGVHASNGEHLVSGTISDLDLARAAWNGEDPDAGTLAATPAVTVDASAPLADAVGLMFECGVAHLVVTHGDARPVGVLSTLDIAGIVAWGRA
jgi:CBS domain-containing protein